MKGRPIRQIGLYFLLGVVLFISILLVGRRHNRFLYRYSAVGMQLLNPEPIAVKSVLGNYAQQRQQIATQRSMWKKKYQQASATQRARILKEAGAYLSQALVFELIPYWYGTQWSFDGHTEVPQQGTIACGYFVSTLLSHAGMVVNRYKLAQQGPLQEVLTLHQQSVPIVFQAESAEEFRDSVKTKLPEGMYIFGMTNHVGFLWNQGQEVYFIHSGYTYPRNKVLLEKVTSSPLLYQPSECRLGAITANPLLVRQWLLAMPVVVKDS